MPGILDLMGHVQQQGALGKQQGQESRIARLYSQGLQAPADQRRGIVAQIAQSSPEAANAAFANFGKMDDAARDDLSTFAGQFAAIAETGDEAAIGQMYPQLAAKAHAIGIPVPSTYDQRFLPAIQKLAQAGQRIGTNAELQTFQAMAQGLTPDELAEARKIQLGLAPKKSSAAIKYMEVVGPDGRTRIVAVDPNTVSGEVLGTGETYGAGVGGPRQPATAGNGSISVSLDGVPADKQQRMAQTIAMMRQAGYSDPEIDQFVQTSMGGNSAGAPAPQPSESLPPRMDYANGGYATNPFVSPTEAESAFNKEAAKQAAQLHALPQQEAIKANAAVGQANAIAQGKASIDQSVAQRQRDSALRQYQAARQGLESALSNTETGPIVGRLPALTANQQIGEGAVAAMAPILKQLFRSAGEGTFTDRDQALLLDMVPKRTDLPEAREAKLRNIDEIVRAKLQQAPARAPQAQQSGGNASDPFGIL